jgi:hypothetical protein
MAEKLTKTDIHKKAMLEALEKSLGIVTAACKSVGITRTTHYDWANSDEEYRNAVNALQDVALDFAESKLFKRMESDSDAAIIFYLKTKGRKRGYSEHTELTIKSELPDWMVNKSLPDESEP